MSTPTTPARPADRQARALRLGPRTWLALALVSLVGVAGFGWPFLAPPESAVNAHEGDAPWLFAGLLVLLVAVVAAALSESDLGAKAVAMLGVLAAAGAALRPVGAGTAGLEPMFFLMVLSGRVLGPGFGFALGSVTMFASALLTGGWAPGCRSRCWRWAGSPWARASCPDRTGCGAAGRCGCSPCTASWPPSPTARR